MVFIQFKKSEKNSFMVQVQLNTPVHKVIAKLRETNNTRILLWRLAKSLEELATKGVLKPEELQGISYEDLEKHAGSLGHLSEEKEPFIQKPKAEPPNRYIHDKSNARYGIVLPIEETNALMEVVKKAYALLESPSEGEREKYEDMVNELRGAIMVSFPGYYGLPSWEPTVLILEGKITEEEMSTEEYQFFEENANLWWAGKQLDKNKPISEYAGSNSKTKLIVKLQNPGEQEPPREPPVDQAAYKNMVQYYYKKTEQMKSFQKDSVATFYDQPEQHSKSVREDAHLEGPIKYKPF